MARPEALFERIADVIEVSAEAGAHGAYAVAELLWHCRGDAVTDTEGPAGVGCTRHAA